MARYIDDEPSHVTHHQEILANAINFPTQQWVFPIQTHENNIAHITKAHCGANIKALGNELYGIDGMYTYDSDILLTMCYADCVPVYFIVKTSFYRSSSCGVERNIWSNSSRNA